MGLAGLVLSPTLLTLKIYITFKDVEVILKNLFDISTGFRYKKIGKEFSVHLQRCPWARTQDSGYCPAAESRVLLEQHQLKCTDVTVQPRAKTPPQSRLFLAFHEKYEDSNISFCVRCQLAFSSILTTDHMLGLLHHH